MSTKNNPILVAVDNTNLSAIEALLLDCADHIGGYKLGLEFFNQYGKYIVKKIQEKFPALPLFLDLKLHDIPNTVAKGLASVMELKPLLTTIHASGGAKMISEAKKVTADTNTKLIAVTVLTSLDQQDLDSLGMMDLKSQILNLASVALNNGADGLVCSPHEVSLLRQEFGNDFIIVTPGIRMDDDISNDQKRITTPKEAISMGSSYLVIGRPITQHPNPGLRAREILETLVDNGNL